MRASMFLATAFCMLPAAFPASGAPPVFVPVASPGALVEGKVIARLPFDAGASDTLTVPSPFVVVPGKDHAVLHAGGALVVVDGEEILHEFPVPEDFGEILDLDTDGRHLAAGSAPAGRLTCRLLVCDLPARAVLAPLRSANPLLRLDTEPVRLWRVVVAGGRVGVYQPGIGATLPMWTAEGGQVESARQVAEQTAGLGHGPYRMVPHADGSVEMWARGTAELLAGPEKGEFLDGIRGGAALFLRPSSGGSPLPPVLTVRRVDVQGRTVELLLAARDPEWDAPPLALRGRVVRARAGRIHWLFVGPGFVEVRVAELPPLEAPVRR